MSSERENDTLRFPAYNPDDGRPIFPGMGLGDDACGKGTKTNYSASFLGGSLESHFEIRKNAHEKHASLREKANLGWQ